MGAESGPTVDWIDPTTIYGADAADLAFRDSAFGEDGTRVEGLLPSVFFDFDTSGVKAAERPKLQQAAQHLQDNPGDKLLIEGNCDWRGTTEYNLTLGDRRADSVKQYLVNLGIDPSRIETLSHGDLNAEENASESQMAQDRRADLVIIR